MMGGGASNRSYFSAARSLRTVSRKVAAASFSAERNATVGGCFFASVRLYVVRIVFAARNQNASIARSGICPQNVVSARRCGWEYSSTSRMQQQQLR